MTAASLRGEGRRATSTHALAAARDVRAHADEVSDRLERRNVELAQAQNGVVPRGVRPAECTTEMAW